MAGVPARSRSLQGGGDSEELVTTNVYEHREIERFEETMLRRMKAFNVEIFRREDRQAPGRGPSTEYQVRVWHLDTWGMR